VVSVNILFNIVAMYWYMIRLSLTFCNVWVECISLWQSSDCSRWC